MPTSLHMDYGGDRVGMRETATKTAAAATAAATTAPAERTRPFIRMHDHATPYERSPGLDIACPLALYVCALARRNVGLVRFLFVAGR